MTDDQFRIKKSTLVWLITVLIGVGGHFATFVYWAGTINTKLTILAEQVHEVNQKVDRHIEVTMPRTTSLAVK